MNTKVFLAIFKKLFIALALAMLFSTSTLALDFVQVNDNDFNNANHDGAGYGSIAWHNGKLYVGVSDNTTGVDVYEWDGNSWSSTFSDWFYWLRRYAEDLIVFDGDLYFALTGDLSTGGEVFKWDGVDTWTKVGADGFDSKQNWGVKSLGIHDEDGAGPLPPKLYAGTYNTTYGAEVWRYEGGTTWTNIAETGFDGSTSANKNQGVMSLASYNGKLYAGTYNYNNVGPKYSDGAELWEWDNNSTWTKIYEFTGDPDNESILSMQVYDGKLFFGTRGRNDGAEVWSYDGTNLVKTASDGFGDSYVRWVYDMDVHDGKLYAAGSKYNQSKVYVYDGSTWTIDETLSGEHSMPGLTSDGTYMAISTGDQTSHDIKVWRSLFNGPNISELGPEVATTGGLFAVSNPTLEFTISDFNSDTVNYRIQIDNDADFSSVVLDYTYPSFTTYTAGTDFQYQVGQAGDYTVGSAGMSLTDGNWHWRVMSTNSSGTPTPDWSEGNPSGIDFEINTNVSAPTISALGPSGVTSGGSITEKRPTFNFTVEESLDLDIYYQFQIATDVNFTNLVVDYESGILTEGALSFTVGQDPGTGQYLNDVGYSNQTLLNDDYYWRVKATNSPPDVASDWSVANGGSVAFTVNATVLPPTISNLGPLDLVTGGTTKDKTPSFIFAIDDLDDEYVKFQIQIATDTDFSNLVLDYTSELLNEASLMYALGQNTKSGALSTTSSYAIGSAGQTLANGSYYWRVKAFNYPTGAESVWSTPNQPDAAFVVNYTTPPPNLEPFSEISTANFGFASNQFGGLKSIISYDSDGEGVLDPELYIGLRDATNGGKVMKWDGGTTWSQVSPTNVDFWLTARDDVHEMVVFNDELIVAASGNGYSGVVKYDGSTWTSLGNSVSSRDILALAVHNETGLPGGEELYCGTWTYPGGTTIKKYNGGTSWTTINTLGFGDDANRETRSMISFNGDLYVGTYSWYSNYPYSTGGRVWRYDGGTSWTKVLDFVDDPDNQAVQSLAIYNGNLYAGTYSYSSGAEIWESPDGENWIQVANAPSTFGSSYFRYTYDMITYNDYLYAVVSGTHSTYGAKIWRYDGTDWELQTGNHIDLSSILRVYGLEEFEGDLFALAYYPAKVAMSAAVASTPPVISNLGPASYVDGSTITDTTPTLTFDIDDPNDESVNYQIEIDDSSNFSSPIISYTLNSTTEGSFSFTVGQDQTETSGSYSTGLGVTELPDGNYYWRVMSTNDPSGGFSEWEVANSGSIAFRIDLAPNVTNLGPTSLVTGLTTSDNTPSLTFNITDPGVDDVNYQIQIDDSSNFSSPVIDYTSNVGADGAFSFTVGQDQTQTNGIYNTGLGTTTLANGNYYWRVSSTNDPSGYTSEWTAANGGSIAFIVSYVQTAPTISNVGPASYVDGSINSDTTPTLTFDIDDSDDENVNYQLQIFDTLVNSDMDQSSPLIDYQLNYNSEGSFSFTVGQDTTETIGDYLADVGKDVTELPNNNYYWRVRSTNETTGLTSDWTEVNSGNVAFQIFNFTQDTWKQINVNDFGNTSLDAFGIKAIEWYDGKLYAGLSEDNGSEIYEWNGTSWREIFSPHVTINHEQIGDMIVYNSELYVGIGQGIYQGAQVWKYDGSTWTQVGGSGTSGFDSSYNQRINSFAIHNGDLYAGVYNSDAGAMVYKYSGSGSTWTEASLPGIVNNNQNIAVYGLASYNGDLYAGVQNYSYGANADNSYGAIVYKYSGSGTSWTVSKAWSDDTDNFGIGSMAAFNGNLYAATRSTADGVEVWELNGSTWAEVQDGGFTDYRDREVWDMVEHNGMLCLATSSIYTDGSGVWCYTGSNWVKDFVPMFGETNNFTSRAITSNGTDMFVGTGSLWTHNMRVYKTVSGTAPFIGSFSPEEVITGGAFTDQTPTFNFDIDDPNGDNVNYRIQIFDTLVGGDMDASTPVVDYTSAYAAEGAATFTVGQAEGTGTYTIGNQGQTLPYETYYWRVQSTNESGGYTSEWTEVNQAEVAFTVEAPVIPTVSSLGPASLVSGLGTTDNTPELTFTLNDPEGQNVNFQIQIFDTLVNDDMDQSTPIIDYTSDFGADGAKSFTVGQAAGTGTYNTGAENQKLSNNTDYYWRVKTTNTPDGGESAWNEANSGASAFTVSYTASAPSVSGIGPGQATDGSTLTDKTPTFVFDIADANDENFTYTVQVFDTLVNDDMDQSTPIIDYTSNTITAGGGFTFAVGQAADGGTYTVGAADQTLANGDYYWRVQSTNSPSGLASSWIEANSGAVAFTVNYTAPADLPAFELISTDRFGGDSQYSNMGEKSIEIFQGDLFAGMETSSSNSSKVYKWDGTGTGWSLSNPTDSTWASSREYIDDFIVFDNALYVGTAGYSDSAFIYKYDGVEWTRVGTYGFGDASNRGVKAFAEYNGSLYVGTYNLTGGEVRRYDGGTTWTQVNTDGFGDADVDAVYSLEVYDGYLYAGTQNGGGSSPYYSTGAEIWRYNGSVWEQVFNFADDPANNIVGTLKSINGNLYATTTSYYAGVEVWESVDGENWRQINEDGFGNLTRDYIYDIVEHDGNIYIAFETNLMRYDGTDWTLITDQNGMILGLLSDGTSLYLETLLARIYKTQSDAAPTVDTLGPTTLVNGGVITENNPTFEFSIDDPQDQNINYQIQIFTDANMDTATPVIDYTSSGYEAEGAKTYTPSQTLSNNDYYWRVRSTNENSQITSDWVEANGGSVAFSVNYTPPPPTVSNLGGSSLVDGSTISDTTPIFSFSIDDDLNENVRYQIQIFTSANMDSATPIIDYTSAYAAEGSQSFAVGQAVGSGSYSEGRSGQELIDSDFYWRVRATSEISANTSDWIEANNGSVAFTVFTPLPTWRGDSTISTINSNNLSPGYGAMALYDDQIYVGTQNLSGCEVYKKSSLSWDLINTPGFDNNVNNTECTAMTVYSNNLYVGTVNAVDGAEVWRYNGSNWTQVNSSGFGLPANTSVSAMTVHDGELYAGVSNSSGAQIWKYNGSSWSEETLSGLASSNSDFSSLVSYSGSGGGLLAGTYNASGAEVWKKVSGTWSQVESGGFGDSNNREINGLVEINGVGVYALASNISTGTEVWEWNYSTWSQVNEDGFGDSNNKDAFAMAKHDGSIYVGTTNLVSGAELFKYSGGGTYWTRENSDGFGSSSNESIWAMITYSDRLYMAVKGSVIIFTTDITNGSDAVAALGQFGPGFANDYTQNQDHNAQVKAGFSNAISTAIDHSNNRLFVSDLLNHRILMFNLNSSNQIEDYYADNVLGQTDFNTFNSSGTSSSELFNPGGLAYDSANNRLFAVDSNNNRVLIFDVSSLSDGKAASYVLGQENFTSTDTTTDARSLNNPSDLAYDSTNERLFVTDTDNHRVLVWDVSAATLAANSGSSGNHNADYVLGHDNFTDNLGTLGDGADAANRMMTPMGVDYDSVNDILYVAEEAADRVKKWTVSPTILSTNSATNGNHNASAAVGVATITGTTGGLAVNRLNAPTGVAFDNGALYVSDAANNRIMVFDVNQMDTGEDAINVLGQSNFTSSTGATSQSGLDSPMYLEYDADNNVLLVPESTDSRILFFNAAIGIAPDSTGVLGQTSAPDVMSFTQNTQWNGGSNYDEGLYNSEGMVLDTVNHRLFVADSIGYRVLVYNLDANNDLVDLYPDNVLGQPTLTAITANGCGPGVETGPPATDSKWCMGSVWGLAYDSANDYLFVADDSIGRVMVFDVASITNGEEAIYALGAPDLSSWGGLSGDADLATTGVPVGVEYDSVNERLFVSDQEYHRVMIFDLSGGITSGMNADAILGQPDATTESSGLSQSKLNLPQSMGYDSTNERLYVADNYNRVTVWSVPTSFTTGPGNQASNVLGQTDFVSNDSGTTAGTFDGATDIEYYNNTLYVSDSYNNRVLEFDVSTITNGEDAVAVYGQDTFTQYYNGTTDQDNMDFPTALAYDSGNDRLYIADSDNNRVLWYELGSLPTPTLIEDGDDAVDIIGQFSITSGSVILNYVKDVYYNAQIDTGFASPIDTVLDYTNHRLFVADDSDNRVLVYNLTSVNLPVDPVPDYVLGQSSFSDTSTHTTSGSSLNSALALTYDKDNDRLFVADDDNRVLVFDTASLSNNEAAINVLGQTDFVSTTGGTSQTKFNDISALEYDNDRDWLYATDTSNNRVLIFDVASVSNGEAAIYALGQNSWTSSTSGTTSSTLNNPNSGLALDHTNDLLYVSDSGNNRILQWDVDTATLSGAGGTGNHAADHVLGQSNFTSNSSGTTDSTLNFPRGLIYDHYNFRVFVADSLNNRILVYDNEITDGEAAVNVLGQSDYTSNGSSYSQSGLNNPTGIAYDPDNGLLYTADNSNNRMMTFETGDPVSAAPGPVTQISPIGGVTISDDTPEFTWTDIADEATYTIEVADSTDPTYSSPVLTMTGIAQDSTAQEATSTLPNGAYIWRIYGVSTGGDSDPGAANSAEFSIGTTSGATAIPEFETWLFILTLLFGFGWIYQKEMGFEILRK